MKQRDKLRGMYVCMYMCVYPTERNGMQVVVGRSRTRTSLDVIGGCGGSDDDDDQQQQQQQQQQQHQAWRTQR